MAEIKTPNVVAVCVEAKEDFRDEYGVGKVPGAIRIGEQDEDGDFVFWYCCPCGCGQIGPLLVGINYKPAISPSWNWNGSKEKPTLSPSVHHPNHWHGHLTDGVWISC